MLLFAERMRTSEDGVVRRAHRHRRRLVSCRGVSQGDELRRAAPKNFSERRRQLASRRGAAS